MIIRVCFEKVMFYHDKNLTINFNFFRIFSDGFLWLASFLSFLCRKGTFVKANFMFVTINVC